MTGPRTSEFTEVPEPPLEIPEPQQRSIDVEDGVFGNRKGVTILAKKCAKMGYDTRLTYARGYVLTKNDLHLRHSLVLRISNETGPVAAAIWEAPAAGEHEDWKSVDFKTHGAIIKPLAAKVGIRQLEEWLLDPTADPRDTYLKEADV